MKDPAYELTSAARLDLLLIWNYLAEEASLDVADKLLADIESEILAAARTPGIGHNRHDLTKRNVRFHIVHSYFIIYRPKTTPIHVIRVLHAARDIKRILQKN